MCTGEEKRKKYIISHHERRHHKNMTNDTSQNVQAVKISIHAWILKSLVIIDIRKQRLWSDYNADAGLIVHTLKCLSIGTLKITDFPFVPNGKSIILGVPIFKPNIFRL